MKLLLAGSAEFIGFQIAKKLLELGDELHSEGDSHTPEPATDDGPLQLFQIGRNDLVKLCVL